MGSPGQKPVSFFFYYGIALAAQCLQLGSVQHRDVAATVADLEQHGGKLQIGHCGPEKRLCVAVQDYAGIFGKDGDYRIAKG